MLETLTPEKVQQAIKNTIWTVINKSPETYQAFKNSKVIPMCCEYAVSIFTSAEGQSNYDTEQT